MKPIIKNLLFLVLGTSLFFTSCSKDDSADQETDETTIEITDLTAEAAETDEAADGAFNIVETLYVETEEETRTSENSLFSDCVTITLSSENGITFVTLDFGLGCELRNGDVVSGIVDITYGPLQNDTRTINYTFDNFTFNEKGIAGGGTIFRERSNLAGNPQSTVNKDIVVSFPNWVEATVTVDKEREWIEGVGTGTWEDNVFLITGNRSVVFDNGFTQNSEVTNALRREATCRYFVSGEVDITRNNGNGVLDYGDGTCDNVATLTVNGETITIILRR